MLFLIRMLWIARAAWGCYATYYILTGGPLVASMGHLDRFSAWTFIVLVGWGPMLFPLTFRKVAKTAWGWAASIYLPDALNAVYYTTGYMWPRSLYWPLALTLAWGPLLFPWLAQARRSLAYGLGASIRRDRAGRRADWIFSDDGLEIAVDLVNREFRLRAKTARWKERGCDWNVGPVEMTRTLLECSLECVAITEKVYHTTGVQGSGVTVDGQAVSVYMPTGSVAAEELTGRYRLWVAHQDAAWDMVGGGVSRQPDGSLRHVGSMIKKMDDTDGPKLMVEMPDLPKRLGARLQAAWDGGPKGTIAALQKSLEAERVAERKAAAEDAFLRDESAARDRWAVAKASASRRIDELRAEAGVGNEFFDMAHTQDGAVSWAIAADREGRAAIMDQSERWAGSLGAARAKACVERAEQDVGGRADLFELVVELDDPKFERERLQRRRFKIMHALPRDKLVAWADRIQILAAQPAE